MSAQKPVKSKRERKNKEKSRGHKNRRMARASINFYNSLPKQGHKSNPSTPVAQWHNNSPEVFFFLKTMNSVRTIIPIHGFALCLKTPPPDDNENLAVNHGIALLSIVSFGPTHSRQSQLKECVQGHKHQGQIERIRGWSDAGRQHQQGHHCMSTML